MITSSRRDSPRRPLRGIQQIQLGTVTGTERDARATLDAIVEAGYEGIELNGFMTRRTPLIVRALTRAAGMPAGRGGRLDWPSLLARTPLRVVGLHEDLGGIERDPGSVARRAEALRTERVVVTGVYRFDFSDPEGVGGLARRLNEAGRRLGRLGLRLLYHNHNVELRRLPDGRTAYELLVAETDPEHVGFEFDCYWPAVSGADSVDMLTSLGERAELVHVTDRGTRRRGSSLTPIDRADSVELGLGNLDVVGIVAQATRASAHAVIVETHRNWIDGSPVASLRLSAQLLNGLLPGPAQV